MSAEERAYARGHADAFCEMRESLREMRELDVEAPGHPEGSHAHALFAQARRAFCDGMLKEIELHCGGRTAQRAAIYASIDRERMRQNFVHGDAREMPVFGPSPLFGSEREARGRYDAAVELGTVTHSHVVLEEAAEAWQAFQAGDMAACRRELIETAASVIKAVEALDAQQGER